MIHVSARSPFSGYKEAMLYGKGPSLDPALKCSLGVSVNEAILETFSEFCILRDWPVAERLRRLMLVTQKYVVDQRLWFRYEWLRGCDSRYFNGHSVLGRDVASESVPGKHLGTGTATAALQLLAEAGVKTVYLNGFDSFWGRTIEYGKPFIDMGIAHTDYSRDYAASGTPEEQSALVNESMRYVIERKGLVVKPAPSPASTT